MKYRKKPVVIEAFQYDGDLKGADGQYYVPKWAASAFEEGIMYYDSQDADSPPCELFITTLEGVQHVSVGDYVIKGVDGELYPCKPDIFEKTYEKAEEQEEAKKMEVMRRTKVDTDKYEVGDVISFELVGGEPVEAMAVKETDEGMIFCSVDCLAEERPMNMEWTNKGGYEASDLRKALNDTVLETFPAEIREKMKPFPNGDLLRIPTEKEIFGENEYGEPEEEDVKQWELMKLRRNRIALEGLNGPWQWYWLQNSGVNSASNFAICHNNGSAGSSSASGSGGVRPVFLIGNL